MGSKRTSRGEFLNGGAVLAGGITLGASGQAQAHDRPMIAGSKELIVYGERSKAFLARP